MDVPDWDVGDSVSAVFSAVTVNAPVKRPSKKGEKVKGKNAQTKTDTHQAQPAPQPAPDSHRGPKTDKASKKKTREGRKAAAAPPSAQPDAQQPPELGRTSKGMAPKVQQTRHQAADSHSAAATSGGKPHKPKITQPPRPTTKEPGVPPGQGVKRAQAEAAPAPGMSKKDKRAKLAKLLARTGEVEAPRADRMVSSRKPPPAPKPAKPAPLASAQPRKPSPAAGSSDTARPASHAHGRVKEDSMRKKLDGARFRWINEQLYTTDSREAVRLVSEDPALFDVYHKGFRSQVEAWPVNPVDQMIEFVNGLPRGAVVGDFGCGEAKLARSVRHKVHSFDLVAPNDHVVACDIANVPLANGCLDVVIFSLSLMGTNYPAFLAEAWRVLKPRGTLRIAEVKSRIESTKAFVGLLRALGFDHAGTDAKNTHFIVLTFRKDASRAPDLDSLPGDAADILKPCLYKRR